MATILNFDGNQAKSCDQGSTFDITLTWSDAAGVVMALSTYTAKMQIRKNYSGELVTELSTDNAKIVLDDVTNIQLILSDEETALLPDGEFVYDFKLTDADGVAERLFQGSFVITPSVTV